MDSRLRGSDGLCKGLRTRVREMPERGLSRTAAPAVFARSYGQYINGIVRIDRILNAERPKSSLAVAESYPFQVLLPFANRIGCNCCRNGEQCSAAFYLSARSINRRASRRYDTYTVGRSWLPFTDRDLARNSSQGVPSPRSTCSVWLQGVQLGPRGQQALLPLPANH